MEAKTTPTFPYQVHEITDPQIPINELFVVPQESQVHSFSNYSINWSEIERIIFSVGGNLSTLVFVHHSSISGPTVSVSILVIAATHWDFPA